MLTDYIMMFVRLKFDKRAVSTIEYALIAALIGVVIIQSLLKLGLDVSKTFNSISSEL